MAQKSGQLYLTALRTRAGSVGLSPSSSPDPWALGGEGLCLRVWTPVSGGGRGAGGKRGDASTAGSPGPRPASHFGQPRGDGASVGRLSSPRLSFRLLRERRPRHQEGGLQAAPGVFPAFLGQGLDRGVTPIQGRRKPTFGRPWRPVTSAVDLMQAGPDANPLAFLPWRLRAAWSCGDPLASGPRGVGLRSWQGEEVP